MSASLPCNAVAAASKVEGKVILRVLQVVREGKELVVTSEVMNRTGMDIWVNVGNNRPGTLSYRVGIDAASRKLTLGLRSAKLTEKAAPEDVPAPRYMKLGLGRSMMFSIPLGTEVSEYDPLKGKGEISIKSSDIALLELEVGYYNRALDKEPGCCMPARLPGELVVSTSWASTHKEKAVSVTVSKKKRWK